MIESFESISPTAILTSYPRVFTDIPYGVNKLDLRLPVDADLSKADKSLLDKLDKLPESLAEAKEIASKSSFISKYIPKEILESYLK